MEGSQQRIRRTDQRMADPLQLRPPSSPSLSAAQHGSGITSLRASSSLSQPPQPSQPQVRLSAAATCTASSPCVMERKTAGGGEVGPHTSLPLLLGILSKFSHYSSRRIPLAFANCTPLLRVLCECHTPQGYRWGCVSVRRSATVEGALIVEVPGDVELQCMMWWLERAMKAEELDHYWGRHLLLAGRGEEAAAELWPSPNATVAVEEEGAAAAGGEAVEQLEALLMKDRQPREPVGKRSRTRVLHIVCVGHERAKAMLAAASLWMLRSISIAKIELSVAYLPLNALGGIWDRFTQLSRIELIGVNCLGANGNGEVDLGDAGLPYFPHEQVRYHRFHKGSGGALRGLEHLPLLRELDLTSSTLDGIGFMGMSRTLEKLNLSSSSISNPGLIGLSDSPSLKVLILFQCVSVSSVQCLTPLYGSGGFSDAGSSSGGSRGSSTCADALIPAVPMVLEVLDLRGTSVTTSGIIGVGELPLLKSIRLGRTKVTHLDALTQAPSLIHIDLENCSTLHPEEGLQGLANTPVEVLQLTRSNTGSLVTLSASRSLQRIVACRVPSLVGRLSDMLITDQNGNCLWALTHLDLSNSPVDASGNVAVLANCVNLEYINLSRIGNLTSVDGLENLHLLRELHVAHTGVLSVNVLGECPRLECLDASHTTLEDDGITDLSQSLSLTFLNLTGTQVSRVGHLSRCHTLRVLVLTSTLVSSHGLKGLEASPSLEELYLNESLVKCFTTWDFPAMEEDGDETDTAHSAPAVAPGGEGSGGGDTPSQDGKREANHLRIWKAVEEVAREVIRLSAELDRHHHKRWSMGAGEMQKTVVAVLEGNPALAMKARQLLPIFSSFPPSGENAGASYYYPSLWKLSVAHTRHRSSGLLGILQLPRLKELDLTDTWIDRPIGFLFPLCAALRAVVTMKAMVQHQPVPQPPLHEGDEDTVNMWSSPPSSRRGGAEEANPRHTASGPPSLLPTALLHEQFCALILHDAKLQQMNFLDGIHFAQQLAYVTVQSCQPSLSHMAVNSLRSLTQCCRLSSLILADTDIVSADANCFQLPPEPDSNETSAVAGSGGLSDQDLSLSVGNSPSPNQGAALIMMRSTPLLICSHLTTLDLSGTLVTNINFLNGHRQLRILRLNSTTVRDLTPLQKCYALEQLNVSLTRVLSLQPLANCKAMRVLNASETFTTQEGIRLLPSMWSLEEVNLSGTPISSILPLRALSHLKILRIRNAAVSREEKKCFPPHIFVQQ